LLVEPPKAEKLPQSINVGWRGKTTSFAVKPTVAGSQYGVKGSSPEFSETAIRHSVLSIYGQKLMLQLRRQMCK
jgi:hypothetical protein